MATAQLDIYHGGYSTSVEACNAGDQPTFVLYYNEDYDISSDTVMYTDNEDSLFNGQNKWWKIDGTSIAIKIGTDGIIEEVYTAYVTHMLPGIKQSSLLDPSINQYCSSLIIAAPIYYNVTKGNAEFSNLLDLVKSETLIYKSETGANVKDGNDMFASNIFSDANGYISWKNLGDNVNATWFGYNDSGLLSTGSNITSYGNCEVYDRPDMPIAGTGVLNNNGVNDVNVFYGFYSCNPEIEGPRPNKETETVFWPIYLIDGLHLHGNDSDDHSSHIKSFVDTLSIGNVIKPEGTDSSMEYVVKIVAEDIDSAFLLLEKTGITSEQRLVVSSGVQIGMFSESVVEIHDSCTGLFTISRNEPYTFPTLSGYDMIKISPNFNTQTNYNLDNITKPLLRTNPKLSGNVKIVTSSDNSIYLESISATKELASIKYKKNIINPNGNYASDVSNFFKSKGTPSDLIFLTKRSESDLNVLDSYNKQIEEEYQYGTTYNYSKIHSEKYRMFAPIWADSNMPSNFVIFKVNDPLNVNANTEDTNVDAIQDILKNAEIVKTFDLSRSSNIGKYIRNHTQQETFPKSPITVSFGKNETTNYNGIDLSSGEITSKGEYIYNDFVQKDKPLIEANDFITDGFKRNNTVCANLLNLEFLFNDDTSDDYSINRYFGLYVDTVDSGSGEISSINNNIVKFNKVSSLVDPSRPKTAIPAYTQMRNSPTLGYICVDGIYYKISNSGLYDPELLEVKIDDSTSAIPNTLGLTYTGKSIDLIKNDEIGYDFVKMSILGKPNDRDRIAVTDSREEAFKFTFVKHVSNEEIIISLDASTGLKEFSFVTGSSITNTFVNMSNAWSSNLDFKHLDLTFDFKTREFVITEIEANLGDENIKISNTPDSIIRVDHIQSNIKIQNSTYIASSDLIKGTSNGNLFSNQGTLVDIASSLSTAIQLNEGGLDAHSNGSDILVKARIPGYRLLQHTVLVSKANINDFIEVNNSDVNNILKLRENKTAEITVLSEWYAHYLNGGNSILQSAYVDSKTISEISIGDYIQTSDKDVYNKVLDIVEDIFNVNRFKLILTLKSDSPSGDTRVFNQNIVRIGLFSAYDIFDMNFDFYDTSNSDLKELVLETTSKIAYEPYDNAIQNINVTTGEFNTKLDVNDIFSNDYDLSPVDYFSNISGMLAEESVDNKSVEHITSEFDRLKENQLKEFAINSRIVPNINKWVLKDSFTVRDQPYYLNTNEAFGRTNFAPDLTATSRNKDDMTHEWFYMDKKPKYLKYDELNSTFSYVNFIEGFELTSNLFKSTKNDYFDKFMITEGFEKNLDVFDISSISKSFGEYTDGYLNINDVNNTFFKTNLKKKYTLIDGGYKDSFASTMFKGLKVVLKNRKEFVDSTAKDFVKNSEFNGYKFSILLRTTTNGSANDIDFEVIQNKKFKFVIFFINLNLSDYWIDGNMNRKLLYELKHKIIYDQSVEDYIYASTSFDGSLSWNTADLTSDTPYTVNGINSIDGSVPDFDNQILKGEDGLYGEILMDIYPNTPGNNMYKFSISSIENASTIKINNLPVNVNDPNDILDVTYLPNLLQGNIKYYYVGGGTNSHKNTLDKISINNMADMINKDDDNITYTTIEEDGTINNNRFTINLEDGTEIVKQATLSVEEDNNKPKSYKLFKGIIGYDLVSSDEASYYPFLIRHNGHYTVDFKPVITFTDMYTHFKSTRTQATADIREMEFESLLYKHSMSNSNELTTAKSYYERYNRCGTTFNLGFIQDGGKHDENWGVIKNHFYHKVNEINPDGVTKLSESSDKLPLYPSIGEIAISRKDVNVFKSSWDSGYYTRSFSGGKSESIPGTLDNTEERSYLASTLMKVKDKYDLVSFTSTTVDSKEKLDYILKNSINESEIVFFEDAEYITADFYITDATVRLLKNDGVLDKIKKYVDVNNSAGDKTTLSDDADFYITKNIVEQFVVDSILLYTRKFKGSASSIVYDINDVSLNNGGYSIDNNFTYKSHKQKPMNFRLIYNKRLGYSYNIEPMIKIKS
jgi:hypothetical protein